MRFNVASTYRSIIIEVFFNVSFALSQIVFQLKALVQAFTALFVQRYGHDCFITTQHSDPSVASSQYVSTNVRTASTLRHALIISPPSERQEDVVGCPGGM